MSSMRNAAPRRSHKERSQPHGRERHGILEKHKDYSLRARDFNLKKQKLKALRQKAIDRNPDEFHFGMISSKTKNGVKIADRGNTSLSNDVVKLLKTQDAGYLQVTLGKVRKEKERLHQEIQFIDGPDGSADVRTLRTQEPNTDDSYSGSADEGDTSTRYSNRILFAEPKEQDGKHVVTKPGLQAVASGRKYRRPEQEVPPTDNMDGSTNGMGVRSTGVPKHIREEQEKRLWKAERAAQKKQRAHQERRRERLREIEQKEKQLLAAAQELDYQRARMSNSVGGVNKRGVKYRIRRRKP